MHKFAFLVHLRSYREDLGEVARPFGTVSERAYRFLLGRRPIGPFVWSEVRLTPGFDEPEGYIIMIPYSGRQLIEQKKQMLGVINKAVSLAKSKGARVIGLGALTSPITLGGKLLANQPRLSVTNGNAYTAIILRDQLMSSLQNCPQRKPTIAIIGATGSVGSLLSLLLARAGIDAELLLIARNLRKLALLVHDMQKTGSRIRPIISENLRDAGKADIIVLVTSSAEQTLDISILKPHATLIDATQPRNVSETDLTLRPDITLVDGGLVVVNRLKTNKIGQLGLKEGISFACMAETMLLAKAGWDTDFSIGNPTLEQADIIARLAKEFEYLGFHAAPDHSFGKLIEKPDIEASKTRATLQY